MTNSFKKLSSRYLIRNKISFFILFLPYLLYVFPRIRNSSFFSYGYFTVFIAIIFLGDVLISVIKYENRKITHIAVVFLDSFLLLFLYFSLLSYSFAPGLRVPGLSGIDPKYIFFLLFVILITAQAIDHYKYKKLNSFLNRTLLIVSAFIFLYNICGGAVNPIRKSNFTEKDISYKSGDQNDKTILFILLDEYSSPAELSKYFSDTSLNSFSEYLRSRNFYARPNFYSHEISTIYSISSLYNFDLSHKFNYSDVDLFSVSDQLRDAILIDSLDKKNIRFINYSFFTIGGHTYYQDIYPLPISFGWLLFSYSSLRKIIHGLNGFGFEEAKHGEHTNSDYNQQLFDLTHKSLQEEKNSFIYMHLLMPHRPASFSNEINLKGYSLSEYFQFWKFTNNKIISFLNSIDHLEKYRIIISGDHGYRADKKIDPHYTFTAFYGFDSSAVSQLHCVQDIGKLVNHAFK